jgi:hypothetical protein
VIRRCDLGGCINALDHVEGREVWVKAEGHVLGPFTVEAGRIHLGEPFDGDLQVGLWVAPVWEGMPRWFVTGNDLVVERPGRIHTAHVEVLASTSIAIGANGQAAVDMPLLKSSDVTDVALPKKSMTVSRFGMLGQVTGTTLVITQTKPGFLRVRDIKIGERL